MKLIDAKGLVCGVINIIDLALLLGLLVGVCMLGYSAYITWFTHEQVSVMKETTQAKPLYYEIIRICQICGHNQIIKVRKGIKPQDTYTQKCDNCGNMVIFDKSEPNW